MFRKVRSFIQRGIRGWANEDTWNLYYFLANVIANATKYLLKTQHGYPGSLTEEEWNKELEEMIWAFEYYRDSSDIWMQDNNRVGNEQAKKNKEKNEDRAKKGIQIFIEHFRDLWD